MLHLSCAETATVGPELGWESPSAPWSGTPAFFLWGVYGRRLDFGLSSYVTLPDPTVWCNASLPAPALTITKPWFEILDCGNTAENLPTFYPRLSVKKIGFSGDLSRYVSHTPPGYLQPPSWPGVRLLRADGCYLGNQAISLPAATPTLFTNCSTTLLTKTTMPAGCSSIESSRPLVQTGLPLSTERRAKWGRYSCW